MGLLQEAQIGRLGSRFSLNFRPRERAVYLSPMGRFYDQRADMGIGLRLGDETHILPFASWEEAHPFTHIDQEFLLEGLAYTVRDDRLGVEFTCRIHSPFYPRDRKISSAPFFYIDLSVRSFIHGRSRFEPVEGEWLFGLSGAQFGEGEELVLKTVSTVDQSCWYFGGERPDHARSEFSEGTFEGEVRVRPLTDGWKAIPFFANVCLTKPFVISSPHEVVEESLVIAGYQPGAVIEAWQETCPFLYTKDFQDIEAVFAFARDGRDELLRKTAVFADTVNRASLGEAARSFIACGFQNYLVNTWWVENSRNEDWFFVWEGWCAFHSTLDVEYNNAWFPLLYWPELLERQLHVWFKSLRPEGYPMHDVGVLLKVERQAYPHDMPVEESCNLILLSYALWRFQADETWRRYMPELRRVVSYLIESDTTGNGYPNRGVSNTIDDAAATVQYAREQTYLAVKVWSALEAFKAMAADDAEAGRAALRELGGSIELMIGRIQKTLETQAWLGDHYAVCLPQEADGLVDVWTGRPVEASDLAGWDAYSLYTANGLLYLLATGMKPDFNYDRLRIDLLNALEKSLTPYGASHSSRDRSNVWLSQNVWRDQVAGYLGIDLLHMTERYWRFLERENVQGRGGCFVDTYGWNWLSYYPRGIVAFGLLASSAGMQVDALARTIALDPVRTPCRLPLLPLADWERGEIPWFECRNEDGAIVWHTEGPLPEGWRIELDAGRQAAGFLDGPSVMERG